MMDIAKPITAQQTWKRPRNLLIAGCALAVAVLLGAVFGLDKAAPVVQRSDLWIEAATRGDMRREIRATGTLVPRDIRWITAATTATVQQVVVLPGARVKSNDVILRLSNPELLANVRKAQAAMVGAQADVAAARASLASQLLDQKAARASAESEWKVAQVKFQALTRAHDAGVISTVDWRESQITLERSSNRAKIEGERVGAFERNMTAQLEANHARRDEVASMLAIAQQQVDALQVYAGIDGILQQVEVEPGQQVQTGSKLARVARPDDLIARLRVPEALAGELGLDLQVSVEMGDTSVRGHISRIDPAVRDGSVTVDVTLNQKLPADARPDLSVQGRVILDTLKDVVSISRPSLAAPNADGTLFVLRGDTRTAQRVPVHFGAASSDRIQVTRGLSLGDKVILSDTSQWNASNRLRVH